MDFLTQQAVDRKIHCGSDFMSLLGQDLSRGDGAASLISFVNPYSYPRLAGDQDVLNAIDRLYVDSMYLASLHGFSYRVPTQWLSFDLSSAAEATLRTCADLGVGVYFVGASQDEICAAIANLEARVEGLRVVGYEHGYFTSDEARSNAKSRIIASGAEVVVAGLGTPLQERFLADIKAARGAQRVLITCGGFLTQTAMQPVFYPKWAVRFGLRWLIRAWREPHVRRRLMIDYPKFFISYLLRMPRKRRRSRVQRA